MAFSFFGKSTRKTVLVIDISSASVGGAFMEVSAQGKPKIVSLVRKDIPLEVDLDFKRFLELTIKTVESVALYLQKEARLHPQAIHIVLASPWYISQSRIVSYKQEKPFIVASDLIERLIKDEATAFEQEQKKKHAIILGAENRVIEVATTHTLLNGYETHKPVGMRASSIHLSLFISLSSEKISQALINTLFKVFHQKRIFLHSVPVAAFAALRGFVQTERGFLYCDISGEITDVVVVSGGSIVETISFPLGKNFLIRSIAKRFATLPAEANALLVSYQEKKLTGETSQKISEVISRVREEWYISFKHVLELSSLEYLLPNNCFLSADASSFEIFREALEHPELSPFTIANKPFSVINLDQKTLISRFDWGAKFPFDTFLAMDILFVSGKGVI